MTPRAMHLAMARTQRKTGRDRAARNAPGDDTLLAVLDGGDAAALQQMMARATRTVQLQNIQIFTQRGMYMRRILEAMGIEEVDDRLFELARADAHDAELERLREAKARLTERVSEIVDRQMLMYTANAWPRLREEVLQKTPLARIEMRDFKVMQELVYKLAKRLIALHSRRRRVARRGHLDVRHTIRRNIEYDGLVIRYGMETRARRPAQGRRRLRRIRFGRRPSRDFCCCFSTASPK